MHRRRSTKILLALMVWILAAGLCLIGGPPKTRATWIWNSSLIAKEADQILSFAKQNRINLIFLQVNPKQDIGEYRAFIGQANRAGIAVHALDGDPSWARPENKHKMTELVEWVRSYNEQAAPSEKITGIHLDMEPYNQPAWNTDQRQGIIDEWLTAMDDFSEFGKSLKGVELGADLPFWLDQVPVHPAQTATTMNRWMLEKLDYVTIMAYRNQALSQGGIVDVVKNEMETADRLNKKVIVGIETNPTGDSYTTFYKSNLSDAAKQVLLAEQSLRAYSSYQGIAVHDYEGWKSLERQPHQTG